MLRSFWLLMACLFFVCGAWAQKPVVSYNKRVGSVPVRVVVADLNSREVQVGIVSPERIGRSESVWKLLARSRPTAAVCGTYFCTTSKVPVGDLVLEGETVHFGGVGTAMCIDYDNKVRFIRPPMHRQVDWSQYRCVVAAGPRLLLNGKVYLYPKGEGFKDRSVYASNPRTAVGVTKHNKLLMVVTTKPVSLRTMATVMKRLGAVNAIAMDGGSSTTFYYRKNLSVLPKRQLTNLLVIYESREAYERARPRLAPVNKLAGK